jgi:sugar phosphate isomerase/epimerase
MRPAVSTLIVFRKEFSELSQVVDDNVDILNWEVVDEGFHRLDRVETARLRDIASTRSVSYAVHAPFSSINLAEADPALRRMFTRFMGESLRRAYELEAGIWVLHPGRLTPFTYFFPEKAWEANRRSLLELSREARDLGIRVAVENMLGGYELFSGVKDGMRLLEDVKGENVGLCLDVGHANLGEGMEPFLRDLSEEILHIHVHDNDGKTDSHLAVGRGSIRWEKFVGFLKNSGYDGWVVFENYELRDVKEGVNFLAKLLWDTPRL